MSMPKVLRATLIAAVVVATPAWSPVVAAIGTPLPASYEGPGSVSPEDAVSTYMNGLAAGDLDAIVSGFAVETFVENFDLRGYLEWIGVYSTSATPLLVPAETPFSQALVVEERHGDVIGQIVYQYLTLSNPELDPSETVVLTDDATLDDFYSSLVSAITTIDTSEVGSFTFVPLTDVDPAVAETYESERNQTNLDTRRGVLGADEITDLVVRFTVGGQQYLAFFSVVRYGEAWWIEQLGGNFASLVGIPILQVGATPADEIG